ncbi:MAG: DUF2817 domain-containing protein [Bdellovibrionales bacterium]
MSIKHLPKWATSRGGLAIELYHSADMSWKKTTHPLVMIGGVHGDEPEGVELATATLKWLKSNSQKARVPWILIPCLNPDGYKAGTRTNAAGVDLNRNYPAKSWSPEAKEPRYFPGPSPGSEPEVQAVVRLIEELEPRLVIHCHSWNPCIVVTGHIAIADAERLAKITGYPLQKTIGYDTPGSLSQYGWFDRHVPIICIEEQEGTALENVWPHFAAAIEQIFTDASPRGAKA